MSFGNKRLDRSFDNWVTQTPEEYFGQGNELSTTEEEKLILADMGVKFIGGTYSKKKGLLIKTIELKNAVLVKNKDGKVEMVIKND